ncbi:MAG: hypothetical protein ACOYM3_23835 [Terrimicrobiaceae bacterium]
MKPLIPLALLAMLLVPLRAAEQISFGAESLVDKGWVNNGGIDATVVTDEGKQVQEFKDEDESDICQYGFTLPDAMIPELEERGFVLEARIKQLSNSSEIIVSLKSFGVFGVGIWRDPASGKVEVSSWDQAQGKFHGAKVPGAEEYFTLKAVFEPGKELVVTIDGEPGYSFPFEGVHSSADYISIGNRLADRPFHTLIESFRFGPAGGQP